MKITKVTASFNSTFATAQWGAGKLQFGTFVEAELTENDDPKQIFAGLMDMLQEAVRAELTPIAKRLHEQKIAPLLATLPEEQRKELEAKMAIFDTINAIAPEVVNYVEKK